MPPQSRTAEVVLYNVTFTPARFDKLDGTPAAVEQDIRQDVDVCSGDRIANSLYV